MRIRIKLLLKRLVPGLSRTIHVVLVWSWDSLELAVAVLVKQKTFLADFADRVGVSPLATPMLAQDIILAQDATRPFENFAKHCGLPIGCEI